MDLRRKAARLPDAPGIYLFFAKNKKLVYVGKATSLKQRVSSYFRGKRTPRPIEEMIEEIVDIKHKQTPSVLEAVILEALYIKRHVPKYNVMGKDNKSWNYITISKDTYPIIATIRQHQFDAQSSKKEYAHVFGPFPGMNTKATMKLLRQLFGFSTCQKAVSSKQKSENKKPCLYYQMGQCLGVCTGEISPAEYKKKVITPLVMFLRGNKKRVILRLKKDMKVAAKSKQYEEAGRLRDQIAALEKIHDVAILNKSFFERPTLRAVKSDLRIEGYDISNLGKNSVGSMVVFDAGGAVKSQYRRFKIKTVEEQSDLDSLAEMLDRRLNHREWQYPDVILVDGGKPQVNRARRIVVARGLRIPVVGIAKGPSRRKNEFILGSRRAAFIRWVDANRALLVQVRDEAHRFAIAYQRRTRVL